MKNIWNVIKHMNYIEWDQRTISADVYHHLCQFYESFSLPFVDLFESEQRDKVYVYYYPRWFENNEMYKVIWK